MSTIYSWQENLRKKAIFLIFVSIIFLSFSFFLLLEAAIGYIMGYEKAILISLIIAPVLSLLITYNNYKNPFSIVELSLKAKENNNKILKEIVNNLKIAYGITIPIDIKILERKEINAMVVSNNKRAVLYVTEGALKKLNYYELEALIGHELAHIKNKDSYYMTLIGVVAGLIILFSYIFIRMPFKSRNNKKKGGIIIILIGIAFAILAPIITSLILSAFSQSREFLADSESVYITKNPNAMISLLKKVESEIYDKIPENLGALMFYYPIRTHPPIRERIKKIMEITSVNQV